MKIFDIGDFRKYTKMLAPSACFDGAYTFWYDETNNIRKFYLRESDFNSTFTDNFVLGGLVYEGVAPDVQSIIDSFKLQKSVKEVRFKHIAKGDFIECLNSKKIKLFLEYISSNSLYIHFSSINILYWAIVDIVDSAVALSEVSQKLGPQFANAMKNDLYKLARIEIDSMIFLFHKYAYPNIKQNEVLSFIEEMSDLFADYLNDMEFHFGLESLRQILKEAKKKGSLPFIMDTDDFVLIKDFSHFYLHPIYMFKNSEHIFDNEESIDKLLSEYKIMDGQKELNNFNFVDSASYQMIQLSDVLVGFLGKLFSYLNTHSRVQIHSDFLSLNQLQRDNIDLFFQLIDRSRDKNIGFLHYIDAQEEISKIEFIRVCRVDSHT